MKELKTLADIKDLALVIEGTISVVSPQYEDIQPFIPEVSNKRFNSKDGIIAFSDNNKLYVIPVFKDVIPILESKGFTASKSVSIPFLNGDFPLEDELYKKWEDLQKQFSSGN